MSLMPEDISKGFDECMRVLKPNGTLFLKWSDVQVSVRDVLKVIKHKPLFGNQRGATRWIVFVKI